MHLGSKSSDFQAQVYLDYDQRDLLANLFYNLLNALLLKDQIILKQLEDEYRNLQSIYNSHVHNDPF